MVDSRIGHRFRFIILTREGWSKRRLRPWTVPLLTAALTAGAGYIPSASAGEAAVPRCFGRDATIVGTSDADHLRGTDLVDVIVGLGGDDTIKASSGDYVCGGPGSDTITGGLGSQSLAGGRGEDSIEAGADNDRILGGGGNDTLEAGRGHDSVEGGAGDDLVGGGRDSAVRSLGNQGFNILSIKDVTPIPHNGPRQPKIRRV